MWSMRERVRKILAINEPRGQVEEVGRLLGAAREEGVDALALLGDLGAGGGAGAEYAELLRKVGEAKLPAFYVPGPGDVPFGST